MSMCGLHALLVHVCVYKKGGLAWILDIYVNMLTLPMCMNFYYDIVHVCFCILHTFFAGDLSFIKLYRKLCACCLHVVCLCLIVFNLQDLC